MNRKKKLFIVLSIIILFNSQSCHAKHYNEMLSKKAIGFVLLGAITIIGFYKLLNYAFAQGAHNNSIINVNKKATEEKKEDKNDIIFENREDKDDSEDDSMNVSEDESTETEQEGFSENLEDDSTNVSKDESAETEQEGFSGNLIEIVDQNNSEEIQDNFDKSTMICDQADITEEQEILLQNYHPTSLKIFGNGIIRLYDSYILEMVNEMVGWNPMEKKMILAQDRNNNAGKMNYSIKMGISSDNCLTISLSLQDTVACLFLPMDTMRQMELYDDIRINYEYNYSNNNAFHHGSGYCLNGMKREDLERAKRNLSLDIKLYNNSRYLFPAGGCYADYWRVGFDVLKIDAHGRSGVNLSDRNTFIQCNFFDDSGITIYGFNKLYLNAKDRAEVCIKYFSANNKFNINMQDSTKLTVTAFYHSHGKMSEMRYKVAPLLTTDFNENHMSIGSNARICLSYYGG